MPGGGGEGWYRLGSTTGSQSEWTRGTQAPVARVLPAWPEGCGRAAFCTEIFVLQLGSARPRPRSPLGRALGNAGPPPPLLELKRDRTDVAAPTPSSGSPWGGGESAIALLLRSGCVPPIWRMETWASEKYVICFLAQCCLWYVYCDLAGSHFMTEKTEEQGGGATLQGSAAGLRAPNTAQGPSCLPPSDILVACHLTAPASRDSPQDLVHLCTW